MGGVTGGLTGGLIGSTLASRAAEPRVQSWLNQRLPRAMHVPDDQKWYLNRRDSAFNNRAGRLVPIYSDMAKDIGNYRRSGLPAPQELLSSRQGMLSQLKSINSHVNESIGPLVDAWRWRRYVTRDSNINRLRGAAEKVISRFGRMGGLAGGLAGGVGGFLALSKILNSQAPVKAGFDKSAGPQSFSEWLKQHDSTSNPKARDAELEKLTGKEHDTGNALSKGVITGLGAAPAGAVVGHQAGKATGKALALPLNRTLERVNKSLNDFSGITRRSRENNWALANRGTAANALSTLKDKVQAPISASEAWGARSSTRLRDIFSKAQSRIAPRLQLLRRLGPLGAALGGLGGLALGAAKGKGFLDQTSQWRDTMPTSPAPPTSSHGMEDYANNTADYLSNVRKWYANKPSLFPMR